MDDLCVLGLSSRFESLCSFGVVCCLLLRCSRQRLRCFVQVSRVYVLCVWEILSGCLGG
jgi:hypothetical protein